MAKVAVVTGASSGVGRAVVIALAREGWDVFAVARREAALSNTVAMTPAGARSHVYASPVDVINRAAVERLAQIVLERFARIDLMVNAAGTNIPLRSLEQMTPERFHEVFDVNLMGALNVIQAFVPTMRQQQSGTIVNINSNWSGGAVINSSIIGLGAFWLSQSLVSGVNPSNKSLLVSDFEQ